jgi:DNA-binding CsgD family transcriptional regulator
LEHVTEGRRDRWTRGALAAVFALLASLAAADLLTDLGQGTTVGHVAVEGGMVLAALAGAGWLAARLVWEARTRRRLERDTGTLRASLDASRAEAERWRREAKDLLAGLGEAIDAQLARWGLTPAEKEVALLLLKGLSHKEVAAVRDVAESSVRQQARALYKKAGLQGRSELAAFFLEDLLAPRTAASVRPAASRE